LAVVLFAAIIGVAVVGFFVGINAGVPREDYREHAVHSIDVLGRDDVFAEHAEAPANPSSAIPAASYSEMRRAESAATNRAMPSLEQMHSDADFQRCVSCHNPHTAAVGPNQKDKLLSLATRASRRAYNGAPPVIPHAIERTNDAACYACHGDGARIDQRVANRMSHGPLANCLQCHATSAPQPFAQHEVVAENSFVGLPAPAFAERAYDGAPPLIPHSTWMRERCLSCHGGIAGWPGLEVTHRWRTNCLQCHATSAKFEQAIATSSESFDDSLTLTVP
jgi:cytochrome c-type protein NapB